ncbi:MAG: DUF1559 domain-containing protein [Planctomycetes bacterium]|nr:DUF1559 domain-containing protein [Planctomycetota bacterium]
MKSHISCGAFALFCLAIASAIGSPVLAGDKPSSDLAFIPADAAGFIHVRVADVWKSEFTKEWRETVMKAGVKALAAYNERFYPSPANLERLTVFMVPPGDQHVRDGEPIMILGFAKAIDRNVFLDRSLPGAKEENFEGRPLLIAGNNKMEIFLVDDHTLVAGSVGAVRGLLKRPKARKGDLASAIKLAQEGKPVVVALRASALPPNLFRDVPPPLLPILKARVLSLTFDPKGNGQIDLRAAYAGAQEADAAEKAADEGMQLAHKLLAKGRMELEQKVIGDGKAARLDEFPEATAALLGLGWINRVEEYLSTAPIKRKDNDLHLAVKLPAGGQYTLTTAAVAAGLLVPAVQKVRQAASRSQGQNNLKQIALAMHIHHDSYKKFPAAAICDKNGKPLLSWRVTILPYIEQDHLYQQFKLDEPWDSEHNKKLISQMPPVYEVPAAPEKKPGETYYRVLVGGGAGFEWSKGLSFRDITDGSSNTIMVVEAAQSVPWTKPDELVYDAQKPLPKFGDFHGHGGFNAAFFDGSVRFFLESALPEATLRAYITRAGGEKVRLD